jgi:hypothetical protein
MQRTRDPVSLRLRLAGALAMVIVAGAVIALLVSTSGPATRSRSGSAAEAASTPENAAAPERGAAAPRVEQVSAHAGASKGGSEVTITGAHLGTSCSVSVSEPTCPAVIVYFGHEPGFVFSGSSSRIEALAPPHPAGTVTVTVVTPNGSSASRGQGPAADFTYSGPGPARAPGEVPVVKAVEPNHSPAAGFFRVRIKGDHLTTRNRACMECSGDVVHFGSESVAVAQGTQHELLVISPPHAPGTVNVTVTTNPGGTNLASTADLYTYG